MVTPPPSRLVLAAVLAAHVVAIAAPPRAAVDPAANGLKPLKGAHITIWTDLDPTSEMEALPKWFDKAYDRWSEYFGASGLDEKKWQVTGSLMGARERFSNAGLLPADLPEFPHGYSRGQSLWLYEQKDSDYYRRHLLLHEGVHLFMNHTLGGCGPPWYMEGMAELLATHRLDGEQILLPYFPANRQEVPRLGRIKLVRDAIAAGVGKSLEDVLALDNRDFPKNEAYAWSWAVCAFLDGHPRYRLRFRRMAAQVTKADFNRRFRAAFGDDWPQMSIEFRVFAGGLAHGYDLPRMAIAFAPGKPLAASGASLRVAADRGWQSSGVALEAGGSYQLTADGCYQVDDQPETWWCEPQGVTARYVDGQPLGRLLAAVVSDQFGAADAEELLHPLPAGRKLVLQPQRGGTLYLRINDAPDSLVNNAGEAAVKIAPARDP